MNLASAEDVLQEMKDVRGRIAKAWTRGTSAPPIVSRLNRLFDAVERLLDERAAAGAEPTLPRGRAEASTELRASIEQVTRSVTAQATQSPRGAVTIQLAHWGRLISLLDRVAAEMLDREPIERRVVAAARSSQTLMMALGVMRALSTGRETIGALIEEQVWRLNEEPADAVESRLLRAAAVAGLALLQGLLP